MGVMYSERIRWLVLSYICRRLHGLFVVVLLFFLGGGGGGGSIFKDEPEGVLMVKGQRKGVT